MLQYLNDLRLQYLNSFAETFTAIVMLQYFCRFCGRSLLLKHSCRPLCCRILRALVADFWCWSIQVDHHAAVFSEGFMADFVCWNIHGDHYAAAFSDLMANLRYLSIHGDHHAAVFLNVVADLCCWKVHGYHRTAAFSKVLWPISVAAFTANIMLQCFLTFCGRSEMLKHSGRTSCCSIFKWFVVDLFRWNIMATMVLQQFQRSVAYHYHTRRLSLCSIIKRFLADLFCWNIHGDHHAAVFLNFLWPISSAETFFINIAFAETFTATIQQYFQTFYGRSF